MDQSLINPASRWEVVYERAYNPDGSLFFRQKLTAEFLEQAKRTMGSYMFANQYLNEIIPTDKQTFKKEWFKYYDSIPEEAITFCFVDPAISQADTADYTGVVVVAVDNQANWYVKAAKRYKITPTQIINLLFELDRIFSPRIIGVEEVAYQKALLYFMDEEMRRRNKLLPIKGVKPPLDKSKQARILGALVPRIEWGRLFFNKGLEDFELELLSFPRGAHDDLIDAAAGIEYIYYKPDKIPEIPFDKLSPHHQDYERRYIETLAKKNESNRDY